MSVSALCIGQAAYDLCMVVDGYPPEDAKSETDLFLESGGGPAANAAWLLARWGVPTALAALVGADKYGTLAIAELEKAEVDCALVERRARHSTPVSFILANRANGSRTIINRKAPAPGLHLRPRQLRGLMPKLLLFDGHEPAASLAAMKACPSALTVLDAGSLRPGTRLLATRVDYLVCSEKFARQFTDCNPASPNWRACLGRLRKLNRHVVVVTLGKHGLIYHDGQRQEKLPACPVEAVDTTAAGDVFHGAFAYGVLRGMELKAVLQWATLAASLSVQKFGGRPSFPMLTELKEAFMHG